LRKRGVKEVKLGGGSKVRTERLKGPGVSLSGEKSKPEGPIEIWGGWGRGIFTGTKSSHVMWDSKQKRDGLVTGQQSGDFDRGF